GKRIGNGVAELARLAADAISGLDPRISDCQIELECEETNQLIGEQGASVVLGKKVWYKCAKVVNLDG
ncbi:glycerate kinase, partial [Erwinia amylovora]|uniref:glycerate kinase n=1 Tax=Erwinia amylovora TaxID=552 RepID=UPI002009DCDA